jgi:hypothetical protein
MFWWFKRGDQFLQYEARAVSTDAYELTVALPDGTVRVEHFTDQTALTDRQVALVRELEDEGWTGPHGWNL